ncbi:MAG: RidA family protein [Desulfohalobiaceae bacterium]|nr:RidA family protein [Desulfohalobiaceae bacterium]
MDGKDPLRIIESPQAPQAIGPYSQAVAADNLLFVSGQLPLDPLTGYFVQGDIGKQTHQCLENIRSIAQAAGSDLDRAVKLNIYLKDIADFKAVNEAYAQHFPQNPPARLAIQVAALPRDAEIEIEAIISLSY